MSRTLLNWLACRCFFLFVLFFLFVFPARNSLDVRTARPTVHHWRLVRYDHGENARRVSKASERMRESLTPPVPRSFRLFLPLSVSLFPSCVDLTRRETDRAVFPRHRHRRRAWWRRRHYERPFNWREILLIEPLRVRESKRLHRSRKERKKGRRKDGEWEKKKRHFARFTRTERYDCITSLWFMIVFYYFDFFFMTSDKTE